MILWDTGPLLAAFDCADRHHVACADLISRTPPPPLVPTPVLTEVCITQVASIDHRHFYAVKLRHCDGLELLPR